MWLALASRPALPSFLVSPIVWHHVALVLTPYSAAAASGAECAPTDGAVGGEGEEKAVR